MNDMRSAFSLTGEDARPYLHTGTVVRFYRQHWIAGVLSTPKIENNVSYLWLSELVRFGHHARKIDPEDPGEALITPEDHPVNGSYIEGPQPLRLDNPHRVEWEGQPQKLLVIRFDGGAAILSLRPQDITSVNRLIAMVRTKPKAA